jgi:hypothetical protein
MKRAHVRRAVKERVIEAELRERVEAMGGMCVKVVVPGRRGHPDRMVVLPGPHVIAVETKRPKGGVLVPHQRSWLERYAALGLAVAVVRNCEDITALLKREKAAVRPRL